MSELDMPFLVVGAVADSIPDALSGCCNAVNTLVPEGFRPVGGVAVHHDGKAYHAMQSVFKEPARINLVN